MVTVVYGFDEPLELPHSSAVDHQDESHSDRVLHFGQAVVQLAEGLRLIRYGWTESKNETHGPAVESRQLFSG